MTFALRLSALRVVNTYSFRSLMFMDLSMLVKMRKKSRALCEWLTQFRQRALGVLVNNSHFTAARYQSSQLNPSFRNSRSATESDTCCCQSGFPQHSARIESRFIESYINLSNETDR